MTRLSALALAALLAGPLLAQQPNITNATFAPVNATECDLLTVTLFGTLPNNVVLISFNPVNVGFTWTVEVVCGVNGDEIPVFPQALPSFAPQPPGTYTFIFNLIYNGNQVDSYTLTKEVGPGQTPDPGEFAEHDLCTAGPAIELIDLLGGTPDEGGIWYNPNNVAIPTGLFTPGISMAGLYTYLFEYIDGVPCDDAVQQVFIHYLPNTNPGVGTTLQVCNGAAPPINLFSLLTNNPQTDGTWTPSLPNGYLGTFTPGTNAPGTYTYSVPDSIGCPNPFSQVILQGTNAPNAGNSNSHVVCETDTAINLNSLITGEANTGAWYESSGFFLGVFGHLLDAEIYDDGNFYYVVTSMVCPNDTATLYLDFELEPCFEGLGEEEGNVARFDLLPNPASDLVTIDVELQHMESNLSLDVFDVNGQVVRSERLAVNGSLSRNAIDISTLAKGAYLVRITTAEGTATRRLMVR
jgi:hypothetical protein